MLTTKQVRSIIRKHKGGRWVSLWTNKTHKDTSLNRRVKCYYNDHTDAALITELAQAGGQENVKVIRTPYCIGSIIVKCVLG